MLRKYSLTVAILSACVTLANAQTASLAGKVELKRADGSLTPVAGATVQIYRTDVIVKFPSTTTDSNGIFTFVGLPFVGTYMLSVSGAGLQSVIYSSIKPGADVSLVVSQGDGKAVTDVELRAAAEKEKMNAIIKASLDDGLASFRAKNYDLAIEKFNQGIEADPDRPGSATVLNNNKAAALRNRGVDTYNLAVKTPADRDLLRAKAKNYFQNSIASSQRTLDLIGKITDANEAVKYKVGRYNALLNIVEVSRLLLTTGLDASHPEQTIAALDAYLLVEVDPVLKVKNQVLVADALRNVGSTSEAVPIYRRAMSADRGNLDAIVGLALSLLTEAEIQSKPELFQESLNLMQRFVELAPETHPLKSDIQQSIRYLREEKKLVPKVPNR